MDSIVTLTDVFTSLDSANESVGGSSGSTATSLNYTDLKLLCSRAELDSFGPVEFGLTDCPEPDARAGEFYLLFTLLYLYHDELEQCRFMFHRIRDQRLVDNPQILAACHLLERRYKRDHIGFLNLLEVVDTPSLQILKSQVIFKYCAQLTKALMQLYPVSFPRDVPERLKPAIVALPAENDERNALESLDKIKEIVLFLESKGAMLVD